MYNINKKAMHDRNKFVKKNHHEYKSVYIATKYSVSTFYMRNGEVNLTVKKNLVVYFFTNSAKNSAFYE